MPITDVHPELRRLSRVLPTNPISKTTLPLIRAASGLFRLRRAPGVETVSVGADVSVRVHRPDTASTTVTPALLWIHGGGYVIGSARQDDPVGRGFATQLGITVAAVDYRLAPEHPYPTPLEDCYTALLWLSKQPNVDPSAIAIGGASAGGGLAAALVHLAHDRGEITPAFQLLVYPMLDDRTPAPDAAVARTHRLWSGRSNAFGWSSYLGSAERDTAVPARRTDLRGLPPAWIGVGTNDLFHDEDLEYATRLTDAGVECQTLVVPGAFHAFDTFAPHTTVSREFFAAQCAALRTVFP